MPVYDSKLVPDRPIQGFACHAARRVRLEHEALAAGTYLRGLGHSNKGLSAVVLGRKDFTHDMMSKVYLESVVVDHPHLDKFLGSGE
jgi:hypothetical protein